jgi:hypothetical protein
MIIFDIFCLIYSDVDPYLTFCHIRQSFHSTLFFLSDVLCCWHIFPFDVSSSRRFSCLMFCPQWRFPLRPIVIVGVFSISLHVSFQCFLFRRFVLRRFYLRRFLLDVLSVNPLNIQPIITDNYFS